MNAPDVDHVIAVHDVRRPVMRAVGSVLDGTTCDVRVTVVCHNLSSQPVLGALGTHASDPRLRVLEVNDGVPSPSGPFNAGLDAATAAFTSIMGSDDELEPGAIDSWLALARHSHSDVVIARVVVVGRGGMLSPPTRPFRGRRLDGVRDRLAYRSAPLGLVSRERFGELRFPPGLRSGEDVDYTTRLWFSAGAIAFDRSGPAYLVHEDAPTRVSTRVKPLSDDAAFVGPFLQGEAFRALNERQRTSVVVKLLRSHVLQWIVYRPEPELWAAQDLEEIRRVIAACRRLAPSALACLSRTDRAIIDAFSQNSIDVGEALTLVPGRTRIRPRNLLTPRVHDALRRDAPLRFAAASTLVARQR